MFERWKPGKKVEAPKIGDNVIEGKFGQGKVKDTVPLKLRDADALVNESIADVGKDIEHVLGIFNDILNEMGPPPENVVVFKKPKPHK